MSFSLSYYRRFKFKLLYDVIDTNKPWEYGIYRSSLDDYNDNGLEEYKLISIGVDNEGFFYKYLIYEYDLDNLPHPVGPYKVHLTNMLSGTFEIEFSPLAYFTVPSIDDVYKVLFEELGVPNIVITQKHVTANFSYSGLDLMLQILPENNYKFNGDEIKMNFQIYGNSPLEDVTPYIHTVINTSTELLFRIELTVQGVATNYITDAGYEFYLEYVNVYKNPLDITETYNGCTGSNTSPTVAYNDTYTNVLTALNGYTLDNSEVHVYMDGEELNLANIYDSNTHTITVTNVTGDIVVTVSAVKLFEFKFYSSDGNTLHATYIGPFINSILFTLNGTQRTLIINGTHTYTWIDVIPSDYSLIGFSDSISSDTFIIPLNIDFTNILKNNMNFYETIVKNVVFTGTFTLNLYKNSAEKIRVDKTNYLTFINTLNGLLRDSFQITKPRIRIEYPKVPDFNYVFIPQLNRYYFVDEVISVSNKIWDIILSVDVLMSFKDTIRSQYAFVERNQYTFDTNIEDNKRTYEKEPEIEYIEIENSIFDVERTGLTLGGIDYSARIVITVVGKG